MIGYIKGTIAKVGENHIILENNGIGYLIYVPVSSMYRFGEGVETVIYTYMAVKEDDISLYGFCSDEELSMFKLLITVSGIGPKGALSILSNITVDELKMAIEAGDAKLISSSKGVGLKTAQKLVVELKGKFEKEIVSSQLSSKTSSGSSPEISEALSILEALGFNRSSGMKAINKINISDDMKASDIVSEALRSIE